MNLMPVAVTPKEAFDVLRIGNTKGYELIKSGELEAVKIGRSTRITWASILRLVENAPRELSPSRRTGLASDAKPFMS